MSDIYSNRTKFTLQDMEKVRKGLKDIQKDVSTHLNVPEENVKVKILQQGSGLLKETAHWTGRDTKETLAEAVQRIVARFDQIVFDKALAFTKFFLSERGEKIQEVDWYHKIGTEFFNEFIQFYEFFLENDSNISDMSTYLEDFKAFFNGYHLDEADRLNAENSKIEQSKTKWFKGIMDAFNQEPNDDQYWDDDQYFNGYQRGTEIFRSLMKESKLLFPVKKPKINKFIEQQKKLVEIINKFDKARKESR